jgi:hypothetical protein
MSMVETAKDAELRALFNAQTGQVAWSELERPFARGALLRIDAALDLVAVACRVAQDDTAAIQAWMVAGQVGLVNASEAAAWQAAGQRFWAVVAAPYVLVQVLG